MNEAPGQEELNRFREQGFTADEMSAWVLNKRQELGAAGFQEHEIDAYFGQKIPNPKPVVSMARKNIDHAAKPVTNFSEAWEAGWGMGTTSLGAAAMTGGSLPSVHVTKDTPWYLRAASNVATLVNDVPAMVTGALLGGGGGSATGPGATITTAGGAFALPAALRRVYVDAIENGEIKTKSEFVDLAVSSVWEGVKGWITGAATAGAGIAGKAVIPKSAPLAVRATGVAGAELTAMVTTSKALEGHLPEMQDFADGALILFGLKGAMSGAGRLRNIWARTGVPPRQIVEDAKTDPQLWQEIIGGETVPTKYQPLASEPVDPPLPPLKTETPKGGKSEPALSPEAEARAIAYFERPFSDKIPSAPGEPARPPYTNHDIFNTTEGVKQSLDKLSELYETEIQTQRRGVVPNKQSYQEAKDVFAELLGIPSKKLKIDGEKAALESGDFTKLTANLYARKEIATRFAEELLRRREALVAKGAEVTPLDRMEFMASVEATGAALAQFMGSRAEVGRALQILKSSRRERGAKQLEAIKEIMDQYGGEANIDKMIGALGELKDPAQVTKFAREASKATTWDMLMEAYRASLISGMTTMQVNAISTTMFSGMRIPIRAVAAVYGKLHGGEKVYFGETIGASIGMAMGAKEAAIATAAMAKHGLATTKEKGLAAGAKEVGTAIESAGQKISGKAGEGRQGAIPGVTGHIVRTPFLALSLPDLFLKTLNQRSELYALAVRDALSKDLKFGSKEFNRAVAETVSEPSAEMLKAANEVGMRNTFNAPPGKESAMLGAMMNTGLWKAGQIVIPFRRTAGNIFKEGSRMTPGLNLAVREWREDFAAGGAKRDMALAEVTVGFAIMGAVMMAANDGNVTGGGSPERNQRATDMAAGKRNYAFKVGDKYYDGYQRMAPYGQLVGIAADMVELRNYMTQEEHDQLTRMVGFAFAQNVTNQTFMQGVTNAIAAAHDPGRYGQNYVESFASMAVPNLLAQYARERDPLQREIEGFIEAVRARIPGWREGLRPKIDLFGEPIAAPEKMWAGSPFSVSSISGDKVRTEASRIGFAAAPPPKNLYAQTGIRDKNVNKIVLTPEQRDIFETEGGRLAHKALEPLVNSEDWDKMPQLMQRQVYEMAFARGRHYATIMALTPQQRADATQEAVNRIIKELTE